MESCDDAKRSQRLRQLVGGGGAAGSLFEFMDFKTAARIQPSRRSFHQSIDAAPIGNEVVDVISRTQETGANHLFESTVDHEMRDPHRPQFAVKSPVIRKSMDQFEGRCARPDVVRHVVDTSKQIGPLLHPQQELVSGRHLVSHKDRGGFYAAIVASFMWCLPQGEFKIRG